MKSSQSELRLSKLQTKMYLTVKDSPTIQQNT